jgi:eukaryotic-like serine/threonine-protein kinase
VVLLPLQPADPQAIGPYRLLGQLGAGGMGQVFLGLSAGGRLVAVKVIRAELAADPEFRARFRREIAAAHKVSGLYTAAVVDADVDGLVPWLATAYVAGPSLAEAVSEHGPLPAASVLALAAGLAESLTAIHAAGVTHRDLKPSNVLLAVDGPRVIDFGISRAAEATSMTRAGFVMGSPGFMSPEQAEGHDVGPASDMFSLGAVLAFAATGDGPFGGGSTAALVYRVVHSPANLDHVPDEVRPLAERCLAKDPSHRPAAAELLADVGAVQPAAGWLPEPIINAIARDPALAMAAAADDSPAPIPAGAVPTPVPAPGAAQTVTAGKPSPVPRPAVSQPPPDSAGRRPQRRLRRPAALALITGALLVASAGVGLALAGTARHAPAAHSQSPLAQALTTTSPAVSSSAPPASPATPSSTTPSASTSPPVTPTTFVSQPPASPPPASTHPATPSTHPATPGTPASTPAVPKVPQITSVGTYQQGVLVYFNVRYADPGHNAVGFGFVGVNGSRWAEENHPFSSPSFGIVGTDSIAYPFNEACGTAQQYASYVQVWIYDTAGAHSNPVVIHLVCAT